MIELRVSDLGGRIVASTDPARIGDTARPPEGEASGAPIDTAVQGPLTLPTGQRVLELAVPIPDPDGGPSPVGRLTARYDWKRQATALDRARQNLLATDTDVEALIANAAGVVIATAPGEGAASPAGANLRAAGWRSAAATLRPASFGFVVEERARRLVGYARLGEEDPPWTLLVVQRLSKALKPVADMTLRLAIGLAGVLAAGLGVALFLGNRIAGPLRALTQAMQAVAGGVRAVPVAAPRTRDEVAQLTSAFNQMLVDLRRAESEVLEAAKFAFVGELAAGVAHQVRTALGVLRSSVQILQPSLDAGDREGAELVDIMLAEIDHLDEVVTQLLRLGRPRELTIAPARLCGVVSRAADFVEAQARGQGVVVRRSDDSDGAVALCDEEQVYQVALNLIVNAIQASGPGGEVTVAVLAPRAGMVGFEVRDHGPGIPGELREKIFLPFFTRREGGTGLGLTLVRRVVQEHRGRLSLESNVGGGSVFCVELRLSESAE